MFDRFLPDYRPFHRDLLFHQPDSALWRSLFLAKACGSVLAEGGPWDEADRIVPRGPWPGLNDFIGHRPVAVLRHANAPQPYPHEWVAPIPLFAQQAWPSAAIKS